MILKNSVKALTTSTALLSGLFLITGCSSDDGGGSGASVPANAIVINAANAETTVASATTSTDTFGAALPTIATAAETTTTPNTNLKSALKQIKLSVRDNSTDSGIDLATGAAFEDSGECLNGGTYSQVVDVTSDGENSSYSGSASFVNCNNFKYILSGTLSFSSTNNSAGDYTDNMSGSMGMSVPDSGLLVNFAGFDLSVTGNYFDYSYTVNRLSYSVDFVTANGSSGGYLITLTAPIVENSGTFFSCPESGHITITGADGTTAEGIYNGGDTMTIKANGEVVNAAAPCYY